MLYHLVVTFLYVSGAGSTALQFDKAGLSKAECFSDGELLKNQQSEIWTSVKWSCLPYRPKKELTSD